MILNKFNFWYGQIKNNNCVLFKGSFEVIICLFVNEDGMYINNF